MRFLPRSAAVMATALVVLTLSSGLGSTAVAAPRASAAAPSTTEW
ncbi:hypothetical protein [Streptomyces sp. NPDC047046]